MDTAIVTYGRGWPALSVVRSLGKRGIKVVCGDSVGMVPSSFSRYCAASFTYPDPQDDPEGFLRALEDVIREHKPAPGEGELVLIPVHKETFLVSEHVERFEALGVRLALPAHAHIEQTHDKGRLAELARELSIEIPETRSYTSLGDVYRDAPDLEYPCFVKLRGAAAGVGVQKVDTPEELVQTYREFLEDYELEPAGYPLVQGFAPGDDYCVTALFDRGECVAAFTYHNVRQFPRTTGAGVLREPVAAPEAEAISCRLLEHLGWHGLAQLDFRWDEGGRPKLIELNPRFFGGLPQAVASGVDYPHLVFQLAKGERPARPEVDYSVRTETPVLGVLATLSEIRHDSELKAGLASLRETLRAESGDDTLWQRLVRFLGRLGQIVHPVHVAGYLRKMFAKHRGTINDVFRSDDPLPVLGILYPVSVMLKQGTLSTAALLSEAQAKVVVAKKGFRQHLQPSWTTLTSTAAVFLVGLAVTTWAFTSHTPVGQFFLWPLKLAEGLVPAGSESLSGQAVFSLINFTFLYVLAAFGLKLRDEVRMARSERQTVGVS